MGSKLLKVADKLNLGGGKKKPDLPDAPHKPHGLDGPDNPKAKPEFDQEDKEARDWFTMLALAKGITEGHDALDDVTVTGLLAQLNGTLALRSHAVSSYKAEPMGGGVYQIVQFAKPKSSKVGKFDGKKEEEFGPVPPLPDKVIFQDRTVRIWHNFGNLGEGPGTLFEHAPIHYHVKYKGKEYRAFPSGKALRDSAELPEEVQAIFQANKKRLYDIERAIGTWFKYVKSRGWTNR